MVEKSLKFLNIDYKFLTIHFEKTLIIDTGERQSALTGRVLNGFITL